MRLHLLTVGRVRQTPLAAAAQDYLDRLSHYTNCEEIVVREERAGKGLGPADVMRREGERILARLRPEYHTIALDRSGEEISSESLAKKMSRLADRFSETVFVIGGAFGLDPAVLKRSDWKWSLSALTYPHELARVMVLEQLYRAHTILRGEPYHK
jgi:23S rRNA (pseudouridine1915-N3)-methyltransferase